MSLKKQENIRVEFVAKDDAPDDFRAEYLRRVVELETYTAAAFVRLRKAGDYGVHKGEIRKDAFARFEQFGIGFRFFSASGRGDDRWSAWVRLVPHPYVDMHILAPEAA